MPESSENRRRALVDAESLGPPQGLVELLTRLMALTEERQRISVRDMLGVVGQRSFAPLLLLAGLIATSPLSGIFGVPTLTGIIVLLVALQMLAGRDHIWLPEWILARRFPARSTRRALHAVRRPAAWIDQLLRPRLTVLTAGTGNRVTATACVLVAISMPPLELMPFAATSAGVLITLLALAIIADDGLLALIALALMALIPAAVATLAAQT